MFLCLATLMGLRLPEAYTELLKDARCCSHSFFFLWRNTTSCKVTNNCFPLYIPLPKMYTSRRQASLVAKKCMGFVSSKGHVPHVRLIFLQSGLSSRWPSQSTIKGTRFFAHPRAKKKQQQQTSSSRHMETLRLPCILSLYICCPCKTRLSTGILCPPHFTRQNFEEWGEKLVITKQKKVGSSSRFLLKQGRRFLWMPWQIHLSS